MSTFYIYKINMLQAEDGANMYGKNIRPDNLKAIHQYFDGLFSTEGAEPALYKFDAQGTPKKTYHTEVKFHRESIIVLVVHNNASVTVDWREEKEETLVTYEQKKIDSYPPCYVIIDYRKEYCQVAIEKCQAWNYEVEGVLKVLEGTLDNILHNECGLNVKIDAKMRPTELKEFIDERINIYKDELQEFTFTLKNTLNPDNISRSKMLKMQAESMLLMGAMSQTTTYKMGVKPNIPHLKDLSDTICICCSNGFELGLRFKNFGKYQCNESIPAFFEIEKAVIEKTYGEGTFVFDGQTDLELRLDEIYQKTKDYETSDYIKAKPKR